MGNSPLSGDFMPNDILGNLRKKGVSFRPWDPRTSGTPSPLLDASDGPPAFSEESSAAMGHTTTPIAPQFNGRRSVSVADASDGPSDYSPAGPSSDDFMSASHVPQGQPVDDSRYQSIKAKLDQMQQPVSLKRKLLRAGEMALPVALGAALGGSAGATGAAQGVNLENSTQRRNSMTEKLELERELEQESGHIASQESANANRDATQPYRDAQIDEFHARADAARHPKPDPQMDLQHLYAQAVESGDVANAARYLKAMKESQNAPQGDEFERLFRADPANAGKTPTLADKVAYEDKLAKMHAGDRQMYPTFTPLTDAAGNVTGRWDSRTGEPTPLTPTPGAPPMRRTGMPGAIARTDIQTDAVQHAANDLVGQGGFIDQNINNLGPVMGRGQDFLRWFGSPDPKAAELRMRIESFAAMNPQIHNFRSSVWAENMVKQMGGKLTPEALKASIRGLASASGYQHQATQNYYGGGQPQGGGAAEYDFDPATKRLIPRQ